MSIELSLRDSELRYRRLFEATQDGILILDAKTGMIEDVNPYLIKMLGYSREEFVEKKLWEVGAFKDMAASQDAFEVLQDREYIRYENLPLKTKDGRLIQVEFVSNVYLVEGEKVVQCNIRDITEHQRIIAALQGNEKKYHDLINQSPDGYFIIELSGNILTVNEAMCKELEFSQEELLSLHIWDIIPEHYLDLYKERLTKVLKGESLKEAAEYEVRGKNGKVHYVEVLSAPRYSGKDIIGFQGVARDITARKQAENALQESEANLRRLIVHLPTVVYVNAVGAAASTLFVSPQIEALLGYTPQEWLADPKLWSKTLHPEDREHVLKQSADNDRDFKPFEMEYRMLARAGHVVWVHDQIVLVKDAEGKPQFWQGIMLDITERKRAEEKLQESEDKYRNLVETAHDLIWAVDAQGTITFMNQASREIYGYAPEELIGRSYLDLLTPEERTRELETMPNLLAGGAKRILGTEIEVFNRDGTRHTLLANVDVRYDSQGNMIGSAGTSTDITERKRAEDELYESEERFKNAFQYSAIGMALVSLEGKWLKVNSNLCSIVGYSEAELMDKTFQDITHPDDLSSDLNNLKQLLAGEIKSYTMEKRYFHKEGRIVSVLLAVALARDKAGVPLYFISQVKDITERKQGEQALRASESKFRSYNENAPLGVFIIDRSGRYVEANTAATSMLGYTESELLQLSIPDVLAPQSFEAGAQGFQKVVQDGSSTGEFLFRRKGGTQFWATVLAVRLSEDRFMSYCQDITERKQTEAEVKKQIDELQRWYSATLEREMRILDLKHEVNELLGMAGQTPRYASAE